MSLTCPCAQQPAIPFSRAGELQDCQGHKREGPLLEKQEVLDAEDRQSKPKPMFQTVEAWSINYTAIQELPCQTS
jgi:hypothetical protein